MKNNWIGKVLGEETAPELPVKPSVSILQQVLGEEVEVPETEPDSKEKPAAAKAPSGATEPPEIEPGEPDHVSDPVQTLASLWTSGGKMDVAVKLLTEPVSYRDFVGLVLAIGNEGALELGQILDDMVIGTEDETSAANNVLSQVSKFQKGRQRTPETLPAPEAEPEPVAAE